IRARAVVVATGVQYRRLPIERLVEFEGAGVYYAATEIEARYSKGTEAITIEYGAEVSALHGSDHLEAVTIRNTVLGSEETVPTRALFIMVGAAPNTDWLTDLVQLDDKGFVLTGEAVGASSPFAASLPGIFAVGDVRSGSVKRVA